MKKSCQEWDDTCYENEVANWAGNLSETWERIFSQEIVGQVLAEGGLEVHPNMVKILTRFNEGDEGEFQASYSRISQWAKRHDKSVKVNYVAPEIGILEEELKRVEQWLSALKDTRRRVLRARSRDGCQAHLKYRQAILVWVEPKDAHLDPCDSVGQDKGYLQFTVIPSPIYI